MGRLEEAVVFEGCKPELHHVAWMDLPEKLQERYRRGKPFFQLMSPIRLHWDVYRIEVKPGAYTDLSSIPRIVELFGIAHRFDGFYHWHSAAICHDLLCHGEASFPHTTKWGNIKLADQMYAGIGLACGASPFSAHLRYRALRMVGTLKFKDIGKSDIITVEYING